ncbi:MAG: 4'-phosphopantetheinyl transferase superfamily protein [Eubacterium sp.]|nr:4'-phosphopantetheinyl transferase superfamily protein [Eubacterium sp.]
MNSTKLYVLDCDALKDGELYRRYYEAMPQVRKNKIDKTKFDSDKRLSLGAGILLKRALDGFDTSKIISKEFKKPYIEGCPLSFNLSHSGKYAAAAVSKSNVGCDIQQITPISDKVAKRFFCPSEQELIMKAGNEEKQREMFFRLWTLKESFIKATGDGMSLPLNEFCISLDGDTPSVEQAVNDKKYSFSEFGIDDNYRLAVCVESGEKLNIAPEIITVK